MHLRYFNATEQITNGRRTGSNTAVSATRDVGAQTSEADFVYFQRRRRAPDHAAGHVGVEAAPAAAGKPGR